jgi:hypothetical protein
MPEAGEYLFSRVGFSREETPYVALQQNETLLDLAPLGKTLTLRFNMAQRFCIGWGDIATSEQFICPNQHILEGKYEQCAACQQRTGFNPAFYHATSISKQQEIRNAQPHLLYLAHFGKGIIKVGISYADRGNARLLEQGARAAIILDTFPSAEIARQYEAKIAQLPGIAETIQLRKKTDALRAPYDTADASRELQQTQTFIEQALGVTFTHKTVAAFDNSYFPTEQPRLDDAVDTTTQAMISGKTVGMLGTFLFCAQQDTAMFIPLKKFIGYRMILSYNEETVELPSRQLSLF